MGTQFFRTIAALQIIIRIFRKPFRMQVKCNFPANQKCDRQHKQAPGISLSDKKQRSEHHCVIPVVDPALAAAFVFHKPRLEGAEKQNADDITDRIRAAQQDHDPVIQETRHMQSTENAVKNNPDKRDQYRRIIIMNHYICSAGFDIIARKLLLTAGAFIF